MILSRSGGWSEAEKSDENSIKDSIQQDFPNIVIVNINYRLANPTTNPHPMHIEDMITLITHLRDLQAHYKTHWM